jgi:hypothetical protein
MPVSFLWRAAVGVFFLAILIWAVQTVPEWQVRRAGVLSAVNPQAQTTPADVAALQNEMRRTFIQVVGGAFALFALYLTFRRVKVAEQGHITDRYTKAIEQLGAMKAENKPNVEVRLGAIYALERIAQDSPRDHWTIMEVLTAYVRQNAPAPVGDLTEEENKAANTKGPATEIQAILTVLGRRRRDSGREQEGQQLDLRFSDLRGANFRDAHMEGARFNVAHVEGAYFSEAHVEGASFVGAHAEGASFWSAHVEGANFILAHVEGARFDGAHVEGAIFGVAHLERADFQRALGLTMEQFKYAKGWEQAHFDEAFRQELEAARGKDGSLG